MNTSRALSVLEKALREQRRWQEDTEASLAHAEEEAEKCRAYLARGRVDTADLEDAIERLRSEVPGVVTVRNVGPEPILRGAAVVHASEAPLGTFAGEQVLGADAAGLLARIDSKARQRAADKHQEDFECGKLAWGIVQDVLRDAGALVESPAPPPPVVHAPDALDPAFGIPVVVSDAAPPGTVYLVNANTLGKSGAMLRYEGARLPPLGSVVALLNVAPPPPDTASDVAEKWTGFDVGSAVGPEDFGGEDFGGEDYLSPPRVEPSPRVDPFDFSALADAVRATVPAPPPEPPAPTPVATIPRRHVELLRDKLRQAPSSDLVTLDYDSDLNTDEE